MLEVCNTRYELRQVCAVAVETGLQDVCLRIVHLGEPSWRQRRRNGYCRELFQSNLPENGGSSMLCVLCGRASTKFEVALVLVVEMAPACWVVGDQA